MMICADCGRSLRRGSNGRWASFDGDARTYACRVIMEDGLIARADYHYVEGEVQIRFFPGLTNA